MRSRENLAKVMELHCINYVEIVKTLDWLFVSAIIHIKILVNQKLTKSLIGVLLIHICK